MAGRVPNDDTIAAPLEQLASSIPQLFLYVLKHLREKDVGHLARASRRLHGCVVRSEPAQHYWHRKATTMWPRSNIHDLIMALCEAHGVHYVLRPPLCVEGHTDADALPPKPGRVPRSRPRPLPDPNQGPDRAWLRQGRPGVPQACAPNSPPLSTVGVRPAFAASPSSSSPASSAAASPFSSPLDPWIATDIDDDGEQGESSTDDTPVPSSSACSCSSPCDSTSTSPSSSHSPVSLSSSSSCSSSNWQTLCWSHVWSKLRRWGWSPSRCNGIHLANASTTARAGSPDRRKGRRSVVMSLGPVTPTFPYRELVIDRMHSDGFSVGVCYKKAPLAKHIGANHRSWGYNSFASYWHAGCYEPYGDRYSEGDVVGIWVDFDKQMLVFYVNGKSQLVACQDEALCGEPLYVCVSMMHENDAVTLLAPRRFPIDME